MLGLLLMLLGLLFPLLGLVLGVHKISAENKLKTTIRKNNSKEAQKISSKKTRRQVKKLAFLLFLTCGFLDGLLYEE